MHVRLAGGFGHACSFSWWLVAVRVKKTESIRLATKKLRVVNLFVWLVADGWC
jgi:hypothetical protein